MFGPHEISTVLVLVIYGAAIYIFILLCRTLKLFCRALEVYIDTNEHGAQRTKSKQSY